MSHLPDTLRGPVERVFTKLSNAAAIIQLREGVKKAEKKRIEEAFALLANKPRSDDTQSSKRALAYFDFLENVNNSVGPSLVVLCAAGLGPSAVHNMKDHLRVALLSLIKNQSTGLHNPVLDHLGMTYSEKFLTHIYRDSLIRISGQQTNGIQHIAEKSLTGDVYELNADDALNVVRSDQIQGKIWLTITYDPNTSPFITIPISRKLSDRFATKRPQMM